MDGGALLNDLAVTPKKSVWLSSHCPDTTRIMAGWIREISWNLFPSLLIKGSTKLPEFSLSFCLGHFGSPAKCLGPLGPFGGRYMPLCLGFSLHTWVGLKSSARNIVRFFFATSELQRCLLCLHALFLDIRWQKMGNNGFDIKTIPNKHRSSASMQKQGHTDLRNRA